MKAAFLLLAMANQASAEGFGVMNELSWMGNDGAERDEPYEPEGDLPFLLTEMEFFDLVWREGSDRMLSDKPWFVDFFAPWCIHCQRFAPTWEDFHEKHQPLGQFNVGKVDCTEASGGRLCSLLKIGGYPTLLYFPVTNIDDPDSFGYRNYNQARTIEAMEAVALQDGWRAL